MAQEVDGASAIFTVPPLGYGLIEFLYLGSGSVFILVAAVLAALALGGIGGDGAFGYLLPAAAVIPGIVLIGKAVQEATTVQRVTVSPRRLTVKKGGPLWSATGTIEMEELEDLVLGRLGGRMFGGPVLIARSDRNVLIFGKGLDEDELIWLSAILRRVLVSSEAAV